MYDKEEYKIDYSNPEYENLRDIRLRKSNFLPSLNQNQQWVADRRIDFFNRIQWIAAGAISLTVPLLIGREINEVFLSLKIISVSSLNILSAAWIAFIISFFLSLYRNKHHVEYINSDAWKQWIDFEINEAEITQKAIPNNTPVFITDKISNYSDLLKEITRSKRKSLFNVKYSDIYSQMFLFVASVLFVIFGVLSL